MLQNILITIKKCGLLLALFFGIVSCEKDLEDIAIGLIDNNYFSVGDSLIEIVAYNVNIDSSRVDNNNISKTPLYLIGINRDAIFGSKKGVLISQIFLPVSGVDFGDNATIDTVILDIPYYAIKNGFQDAVDPDTGNIINDGDGNPIQVPNFILDSVFGNTSQEFNITVNELETFLNVLDPLDPTNIKSYYSNKEYQLKDELFSGDFLANRNDTVLYVLRKDLDGDPSTINQIDTIKALNGNPSMKFNLDENYFQNNFIGNQNSGVFDSNESFLRFFKGLYIDSNGEDGALINVAGSNAKFTIYYTNDIIEDEGADEDLNYNGILGETGVTVRTPQTMNFRFGGVRTGKYVNDYAGFPIENYLLNPNKENGEEKLFVQGAAGSQVILELFTDENLEELRNENWLINEANITIYLDGNQNDEVPNTLFLYNFDENSTLKDYIFDGPDVFNGSLEYDDAGNPERYKFRITRYISDILNLSDPKPSSKLALKNFSTTDTPAIPLLDTIVNDYNWIPKGVVLKGNLPNLDSKRIKLEIYYSKSK